MIYPESVIFPFLLNFLHLNAELSWALLVYSMSNTILLDNEALERVKSVFDNHCEIFHAGVYPTGKLGKKYNLASSQKHRIIAWLSLKASVDIVKSMSFSKQSQLRQISQNFFSLFFNVSMTFLAYLFQCFTTLPV